MTAGSSGTSGHVPTHYQHNHHEYHRMVDISTNNLLERRKNVGIEAQQQQKETVTEKSTQRRFM